MQKVPLTVIIPTFNEEKNIEACLKSVEWAEDVIVIDGQSTDATARLAEKFPVRVIRTENALAETQRLKALKEAHHPWIFLLDADERVTESLRRSIEEKFVSPGPQAAYYVLRRNHYKGRPVHLHHPDYQLRLLRTDKVTLPEKMHRVPKVDGDTGRLNGELTHYFFTTVDAYLKRLSAYTREEALYQRNSQERVSAGRLCYWLFLRPPWRFFQYYFLKKGFLDGYFGFFYSVSSAYYEWATASRFLLDR